MKDKPTEQQIASYLNWLEKPEGDPNLQMALPLSADIGAEASPNCHSERFNIIQTSDPAKRQIEPLSEPEAKSRIRCLSVAGVPIPEIARRTGLHPKYVKAIIEPGRLDRRYE